MACLDTSFVIDLLKGKNEVASLKIELDTTEARLFIPAPALMEIWTGICLSKKVTSIESQKQKVEELLLSLEVLPFDEQCAKEAGEIEAILQKAGASIGKEDIMIAAIAKVFNEKLVTADADYTRIPGLRVLKY